MTDCDGEIIDLARTLVLLVVIQARHNMAITFQCLLHAKVYTDDAFTYFRFLSPDL